MKFRKPLYRDIPGGRILYAGWKKVIHDEPVNSRFKRLPSGAPGWVVEKIRYVHFTDGVMSKSDGPAAIIVCQKGRVLFYYIFDGQVFYNIFSPQHWLETVKELKMLQVLDR